MKQTHNLDLDEVDDLDEISGDEQLSLVWCRTHKKYEWHWLPVSEVNPEEEARERVRRFFICQDRQT